MYEIIRDKESRLRAGIQNCRYAAAQRRNECAIIQNCVVAGEIAPENRDRLPAVIIRDDNRFFGIRESGFENRVGGNAAHFLIIEL